STYRTPDPTVTRHRNRLGPRRTPPTQTAHSRDGRGPSPTADRVRLPDSGRPKRLQTLPRPATPGRDRTGRGNRRAHAARRFRTAPARLPSPRLRPVPCPARRVRRCNWPRSYRLSPLTARFTTRGILGAA